MSNSIADKTFALFANPTNKKLITELENAGARIIKFPTLEAEKVILDSSATDVLSNLKNFDWVIFPDVLTVDFFLQILEENAIDFFELDEIRVCAFGEIVSDRLRFVQLHADVIPNTIQTEDVLSALKSYIAESEFAGVKFLLPKAATFQNNLTDALTKIKAEVFELPVYQLKISKDNEIAKLKALLRGGAVDEFIFSAPNDFVRLNHIFDNEPFERIFSEVKVSAIDGSIFQAVREHNLKRAVLFQPGKIDTVDE